MVLQIHRARLSRLGAARGLGHHNLINLQDGDRGVDGKAQGVDLGHVDIEDASLDGIERLAVLGIKTIQSSVSAIGGVV